MDVVGSRSNSYVSSEAKTRKLSSSSASSSNNSEQGTGLESNSKLSSSDGDGGPSNKRQKFGNLGIELPLGFLDPLPSSPPEQLQRVLQRCSNQFSKAGDFEDASPSASSLNKPSSVGCSKMGNAEVVNKVECERTSYCIPCIGKWVSDISELESFNISKLTTYLRTEFQSVHFKKVEEKLRVLEEEEIKSKELRKSAENLEEELKIYKDKCSELSVELGKLESSKSEVEVELKEYKVNGDELRQKVIHLEKVNREKDKELTELVKNYKDLECSNKPHVSEKVNLEIEVGDEVCLKEYVQQVREVFKMKKKIDKEKDKVKGKPKSKKLAEIEIGDYLVQSKRSRKNAPPHEERKKRNDEGLYEQVDVKTRNKAVEETVNAKCESLDDRRKKKKKKKKKMKTNHEALNKKVDTEIKNIAVEEDVKEKGEYLEKLDKYEKKKCKIGGAKVVKESPSTKLDSVAGASCHQCKRSDRGEIVSCMDCNRRRYCLPCIQNRYPQMSHGEIEKSCPVCRGNCNCSACLRKNGNSKVI